MRWLALAVSVLFVLAAAAAVADPDVMPEAANPPPAIQAIPPPAAGAKKPQPPPTDEAKMSTAEIRKIAEEQYKQCLKDWDAATHMTKQEWQRTCRRLADNRVKFRLEMRN